MLFAKRTLEFTSELGLSVEDTQSLIFCLTEYVMQVHGSKRTAMLKKTAKKFNVLTEVMHFKEQYLDVSSYIHKVLWQNIIKRVQGKTFRRGDAYGDSSFCLQYLKPEARKVIEKMTINSKASLDDFDVNEWVKKKDLYAWVRKKAYKLKFISEADPSLEIDDFCQDLACECIRVINSYQRMKHPPRYFEAALEDQINKYLEGATSNKVGSLLEHHTSLSRRRSYSSNDKDYRNLKSMKKQLNKNKREGKATEAIDAKINKLEKRIRTEPNDFINTMNYMDAIENADSVLNLKEDNTEKLNDAIWLKTMKSNINDPIALDYLDLVVENIPDPLETVQEKYGMPTWNPEVLVDHIAC